MHLLQAVKLTLCDELIEKFIVQHSSTFELEKYCKQYQQNCFYHNVLFC